MTRRLLLAAALTVLFTINPWPASGHLVRHPDKPTLNQLENRERSQQRNLHHARYVCERGRRANRQWHCDAAVWIARELRQTRAALYAPAPPQGLDAAWAWYRTADTQCVVDHEGGWTSPSISPRGMYAGRFQMDSAFERETPFGVRMQDRYGRAWNWPPWAQVYHAHTVWKYAGWSRWPTYARYCA